jgi:hypothetical protein
MSENHARIVATVLAAAEELNPSLEEPVDVALGENAPLYGDDGPLDSLALVTLTSTIEQRLEDELGVVVTLTDERAFSQSRSPFRTVGALAEFADSLLEPTSGAV